MLKKIDRQKDNISSENMKKEVFNDLELCKKSNKIIYIENKNKTRTNSISKSGSNS